MHFFKQISSPQNPLVKKIGLLQDKSRERRKSGLFVLEGWRELQLAIKGNYSLETVLFHGDLISGDDLYALLETIGPGPVSSEILKNRPAYLETFGSRPEPSATSESGPAPSETSESRPEPSETSESRPEIVEITAEIYRKIAYRGTTEGVLAVAKSKPHPLEGLRLPSKNPLILVAEAPEKPGNIGALLRTTDAAGLDAVIIANPKTDLYNPNIVRSSVGCIFTNAMATGSTSEVISYLKKHDISCFCAALSASKPYTQINFEKASAIVVGTEATGLSSEWLENSTRNIIIPMSGEIDSMNVSVSAAILIFEAKRQRGFI